MADPDMSDPGMPDPDRTEPHDLTDLPLQPTGSGVADTEIALMQAAVAEDAVEDDGPTKTQA